MADIKISELTQAESLSLSDLMESAVPYNGGFLSRRMSIAQLANYLENYVQHTALSTGAKSIIGAINEIVGDLDDYYTKSETYSKTKIDELIAGVSGLHFLVVQTLPVSDIDPNTIYLVPKQDVGTQDIYDEFIYIVEEAPTPSHWEKIGTTEIDLSDYVTDTELETILNDYVTTSGLNTILASYATTSAMTTALSAKVDKVSGKGLSTNDYTTAEKTKLNGIESGAEVNVQSDWNATSGDAFIKNKPTIPTVTDNKVKQTATTTNAYYRVLLSKSASDAEETDGVLKNSSLYYNPYDRELSTIKLCADSAFIPQLKVTELVTSQYYFRKTSNQMVAMLDSNPSSTTSNPAFVYMPASSGTLALTDDIPTVSTGSVFGSLSFDGTDKIINLGTNTIQAGLDANDLTTPAVYYITTATNPANMPSAFANGFLIVLRYSANVIKQIALRQGTIDSNDHMVYFRSYIISGWSKWHQLFVGEHIGGVENSNTASRAYAVNELMNRNGGIYRVTQAIASGGAITNNTNVVATTISAEIKAIRDALNI